MKKSLHAHTLFAFMIVSLVLAELSARAEGLDSLRQAAQTSFEEGRFEEAELSALRGLREAESIDDLAEIPFRVVLGSVYVARNQTGFALSEFRRVIAINPAFDLDPVLTSPKILEVFGQAKREYVEQVMSQPEAFRLPEADAKLSASWRSALLPGWGQQYKQQKVKGAMFSALQLATLAAFVAMAIETSNRKDDYLSLHEYDPARLDDRYSSYQSAYRTRNILGYVTLAVYLANYYDALYAPVRSEKKNP